MPLECFDQSRECGCEYSEGDTSDSRLFRLLILIEEHALRHLPFHMKGFVKLSRPILRQLNDAMRARSMGFDKGLDTKPVLVQFLRCCGTSAYHGGSLVHISWIGPRTGLKHWIPMRIARSVARDQPATRKLRVSILFITCLIVSYFIQEAC